MTVTSISTRADREEAARKIIAAARAEGLA